MSLRRSRSGGTSTSIALKRTSRSSIDAASDSAPLSRAISTNRTSTEDRLLPADAA